MKMKKSYSYIVDFASYFSICEGRAMYAGYFSSSQAVHVVVVNPHHENEILSPYILEKYFHEACQALSIEPPARNSIAFKVSL